MTPVPRSNYPIQRARFPQLNEAGRILKLARSLNEATDNVIVCTCEKKKFDIHVT
jgi:hypothetical protein